MPISLWLDGCFDGFHVYAHANAVRQALFLIDGETQPRIVVGVHSDREIIKNKGPPLFDETERYSLLRGCRWIDCVIEDVPYVTQLDIVQLHNIDFVVHGDDLVLDAEGNDCYAAFKKTGKYKECKRTEGISTTSLIGRILHPDEWSLAGSDNERLEHLLDLFVKSIQRPFPILRYEHLTSEHDCGAILQGRPAGKIVYIGGSWDCFGAGHVELLRRAKAVAAADNSFLIVGVWSDQVLQEETGERPLLALLERALAVVQCRYSDALILSSPKDLPQWFVCSLGIEIVVNSDTPTAEMVLDARVGVPALHSVSSLSRKLLGQRAVYEERQRRKGA